MSVLKIHWNHYLCWLLLLLCKKKIVPKQNLTVKVIRYAFSIIIKLEDKSKKLQRISHTWNKPRANRYFSPCVVCKIFIL
jgi:hypothetical protein